MSFISASYVPKNQLEKDQIALLEIYNRDLINSDKELKEFQNEVIEGLNQLNKNNPRCDPFTPSWHELGGDEHDYFISGIRVVRFRIYQIKE
ncbi:MAG: hypothetical protein RIC57_09100 [Balneola sp.]